MPSYCLSIHSYSSFNYSICKYEANQKEILVLFIPEFAAAVFALYYYVFAELASLWKSSTLFFNYSIAFLFLQYWNRG